VASYKKLDMVKKEGLFSMEKVSFNRLSKWMEKKELVQLTVGLGEKGIDWKYTTRGNRCAIFIRKEEEEDGFGMPHWFMWKWAGVRFNRV